MNSANDEYAYRIMPLFLFPITDFQSLHPLSVGHKAFCNQNAGVNNPSSAAQIQSPTPITEPTVGKKVIACMDMKCEYSVYLS